MLLSCSKFIEQQFLLLFSIRHNYLLSELNIKKEITYFRACIIYFFEIHIKYIVYESFNYSMPTKELYNSTKFTRLSNIEYIFNSKLYSKSKFKS